MNAPAKVHSPFCGCDECAPAAPPTVLRAPTKRVVFRTAEAARFEDGTLAPILAAVSAEFEVSKEEILAKDRHRRCVEARAIVAFLARLLTKLSSPEIGRAMRRDHSTVLHLVDRGGHFIEVDEELHARVERVIEALAAKQRERSGL
jgi:chromosomal replication initiation ATPase DnaA